jgi:toxin ParE1/3/4
MKVSFARRALAQVERIHEQISSEDPSVAGAFLLRIERVAALLAQRPWIGRPTDLPTTRVIGLKPYPYLMFYKADSGRGEVTILRIRHMARNVDWRSGR